MEPDRYATVLVALINNPRDLTIAREQHWYRIPIRHTPKRGINAPILAFYQTKIFGEQSCSINYYAYTNTWDIVPRVQLLPDEPFHPRAHDLYYRVTLSELRSLPHSIVSKHWHRVTFVVTHWGRLASSHELGELLHGTIWEERLWRALRKMGRLAEVEDLDGW